MAIGRSTVRYQSRADDQEALRQRLRELAAARVRFGYRRLTVLLKREGWNVNAKRVYRLYKASLFEPRSARRRPAGRASHWVRQRSRTSAGQWTLSVTAWPMVGGFASSR